MDLALEDRLYQAIGNNDQDSVFNLLNKGANPNKISSLGKTCLGEASCLGNINILKLLLDGSQTKTTTVKQHCSYKKRHSKSHKRKLNSGQNDETVIKYKNFNGRNKDQSENIELIDSRCDQNQGYFVFIHSEGSSSDESKISSLKSSISPSSQTPSPQADLEWDEEIGNFAPMTSEDETWTSMYKWYAAILECTGAAIASASFVTYGIDQQDAFMRTALHYAAEQGHVGIVKLLIDAGCKVDVAAGEGFTPLHVAVIRNHIDVVKMLLSTNSQVNYKTHEKMTPLHFAASRGFIEIVKILVNKGVHLEARDTNDRTALYLAAGRGHIDVVKYLISAGANVNVEEIHGYTPLCEAVWQSYASVVEVLLASGSRIIHSHKLLHNSIIQRQIEIVKMLATFSGGINLHNDNGDTPLLLAVRLSLPEFARVLLENGANANSCNAITGANALHIAVESVDCPMELEKLIMCFLEYKIDMNATALTGDTPLNKALLLNKDHAAALLIRHGADVNACDLHLCGLDNLSIASRKPSINLARMLLKAGHYYLHQDNQEPPPKCGSTANWLYTACRNPRSLADECRIVIRHMTDKRILYRFVSTLPLPKSLQRYIMMEDEDV